jgi:serine/threonine protein kinase
MDSLKEVQVKIADFGLARLMMPSDLAQTLCGSPLYMVSLFSTIGHVR